ncbi:MAG TPA: hypothetical protein PK954_21710, partial [Anaerolineales bacterium]|nr:hypothetical protein [Anaerolineales bacterium]
MTEPGERQQKLRRRAIQIAIAVLALLLALLGCGQLALWRLPFDAPWIRSPYSADYRPWAPLSIAPVRAEIGRLRLRETVEGGRERVEQCAHR